MIIYLFVLGLLLGSFISALVWRLYKGLDFVYGRSMCPHCHHKLGPADLMPILSWLVLGGKCRYCRKPVSWQYPATELVTGIGFAASYVYWPRELAGANEWLLFGLWLLSIVGFIALAVYDLKWMLLPDKIMWPLALLSVIAVTVLSQIEGVQAVVDSAWGVALAFGFFFLLSALSGGRWIGGGDVKFGFIIGLWLGAVKAIVAVLLAFYSAALLILPLLMIKKISRKTRIPFGPFLIAGTFVAMLWGAEIVEWYRGLFLY